MAESNVPAPEVLIARGSFFGLAQQVGGAAGYFVGVLILARALGPAGRGELAFVMASAILLGAVAGVGLPTSTTVFAAKRQAERAALLGSVLVTAMGTATVAALAYCGFFLVLPSLRPEGIGATLLLAIALGVIGTVLSDVLGGYLRGCGRFASFMVISVVFTWLFALVMVVLWVAGAISPEVAAVSWSVIRAGDVVVLLGAAVGVAGVRRPQRPLVREVTRFGARAWVSSLAGTTNSRADQWLMEFISGRVELGLYAVAVNFAEVLLYVPNAVGNAVAALSATLDEESRRRVILQSFRQVLLLTAALAVVAAVVGPFAMVVLLGSSYSGSVVPFLILLPGAIGYAAMAVFDNGMMASSRPVGASSGAAAAMITGLVLNLLLIPTYGAIGAAISATAAFLVGGVAVVAVYRRGASFPLRELVPTLADGRSIAVTIGRRA